MRTLLPFVFCLAAVCQTQPQKLDPPFELPASVEWRKDVVYAKAGERELRADLFLPKEAQGPFPSVIYVHGGGWSGGSKTQFHRQAAHMATKGFVGACIEYRLSGEAKYPAQIHDVKAAIRWLRSSAKQYNLRADAIGIAGGSAGGHLALLAAVTGDKPDYEGKVGVKDVSSAVQAVVAFNPAVSVMDLGAAGNKNAPTIHKLFGKTAEEAPELYKQASPFFHVHAKAPPALFLHGLVDETVPYDHSAMMQYSLVQAGVDAELFSAPLAAHGFFNRPPWFASTLKRMEEFLVSRLAVKEKVTKGATAK